MKLIPSNQKGNCTHQSWWAYIAFILVFLRSYRSTTHLCLCVRSYYCSSEIRWFCAGFYLLFSSSITLYSLKTSRLGSLWTFDWLADMSGCILPLDTELDPTLYNPHDGFHLPFYCKSTVGVFPLICSSLFFHFSCSNSITIILEEDGWIQCPHFIRGPVLNILWSYSSLWS